MKRRKPNMLSAEMFCRDIIREFHRTIRSEMSANHVTYGTKVLVEVDKKFQVPKRYIITTDGPTTFGEVKKILEDLGLRREMPSCRHYLLGTIISVKIERDSEKEIYSNYKRPGKWDTI